MAEYFIDIDPGPGNATQLLIAEDTMIMLEFFHDLTGLAIGHHTLGVRVQDTSGNWSFTQSMPFLYYPRVSNPEIISIEYYFDTDPGLGMGTGMAFSSAAGVELQVSVDIENLAEGVHSFHVRAHDENDDWSMKQSKSFFYDTSRMSREPHIAKVEYFIDDDPGLDAALMLSAPDSSRIKVDTIIGLNSLSTGSHHLSVRVKDEFGRWSFPQNRIFFHDDQKIEFAEFKFDSLPLFSDWTVSNPFDPDFIVYPDIDFEGVCDLDAGWYYIDARIRRELSWWSDVFTDSIEIKDVYDFGGAMEDQFGDPIVAAELRVYDVDTIVTDVSGLFFTQLPKCWGDSLVAFKDSVYSSYDSYYFDNPLIDLSEHHVLGDIDTTLFGYKCQNLAGNTSDDITYVCEDAVIQVSKTGEFVDTGSLSGYVLHDGVNTLGTVYAMNLSGDFTNDGSYPRNEKLYISSIVGRPVLELPDVDHPCTDIEFPGQPVVFLELRDTSELYLDSTGNQFLIAEELFVGGCPTCDIDTVYLSQFEFTCDDHGTNVESLTVDDGNGNSSSCSVTVIVHDTIVPVLTCRADTLVETDPTVCNYTVIASEFDLHSTWDNCAFTLSNDFAPGETLTGKVFELGITQVTWTINDGHGNSASCSFQVTVEDNEAPSITCPNIVEVATDPGVCTYTIHSGLFDPLSVSDNCTDYTYLNDSNFTTSLDGEILELGAHAFTWTVDDQHGQVASCMFTVDVVDSEMPQIQCPLNAIRNTDIGQCSYEIVGNELDPLSVTDNCTAFTFFNDSSGTSTLDGTILALGINTIDWTVDDGHGNTAACMFTVNVIDNEHPEIECPTNTSRNTDTLQCSYIVQGDEFDPVLVSDNCPSLTWINNKNGLNVLDGFELSHGDNILIWTADDGHGQTAQCSTIVTVVDDQLPEITCPSDVTLAISNAKCDTAYSYATMIADNCPGALADLFSGLGSGGDFPIGHSTEIWRVTDIDGNTATCAFDIFVDQLPGNASDTICYGDSLLLAGEWQYLPGTYIDTFTNAGGCDSVIITEMDTTTYCIWPSDIVYVDSSALGANTGESWTNAYLNLQLALDVARRYLNVEQIWIARGTYYPTSGTNRMARFELVDSIFIYGGFEGVEVDIAQRDADLNPVSLSGDIGTPSDSSDNSIRVVEVDSLTLAAFLDGVIISDGYSDLGPAGSRVGAGLANFGECTLRHVIFSGNQSVDFASAILNAGPEARLILQTCLLVGTPGSMVDNRDGAVLIMTGSVFVEEE